VSENSEDLTSRLAQLRNAYRTRLRTDLDAMAGQIERIRLSSGEVRHDFIAQLHHGLHKLAGAAGTFGFSQLGQQARRLEQEVSDCHANPSKLFSLDWLESLAERFAQLQQRLNEDDSHYAGVSLEVAEGKGDAEQASVWMVERDDMLADYILQQLRSFGFNVLAFSSPDELHQTVTQGPDILLLDHRAGLDSASDAEVATFWRDHLRPFSCPVVFIGADESFSARLNAVRAGGQAYFAKPIDIPSLAGRISQLLKVGHESAERVLIVDDDVALGAYFRQVLENAGMQVEVLDRPECLIDVAIAFKPELVLMDLHMQAVNGAELVMVLRQFDRWQNLPILYVSSEASHDQRVQALMMGGDAFIEKPVDDRLLINACRTRVRRLRRTEEAISRDSLTGLLKHSSIKEALEQEWAAAQRHGQPVCVAMLDIDHFKKVNDTHGHAVGDVVIRTTGTLLRQHFRSTDRLGRYGGEEFVVVLPHCPANEAERLLNGLRESFAAIRFVGQDSRFRCALSAGIAVLDGKQDISAEQLLEQADQALYRAKNAGRNRVVLASEASH
jgi:diguanylate cyclase (GGDEF)-like protein